LEELREEQKELERQYELEKLRNPNPYLPEPDYKKLKPGDLHNMELDLKTYNVSNMLELISPPP
jgi:hypothetical protein